MATAKKATLEDILGSDHPSKIGKPYPREIQSFLEYISQAVTQIYNTQQMCQTTSFRLDEAIRLLTDTIAKHLKVTSEVLADARQAREESSYQINTVFNSAMKTITEQIRKEYRQEMQHLSDKFHLQYVTDSPPKGPKVFKSPRKRKKVTS